MGIKSAAIPAPTAIVPDYRIYGDRSKAPLRLALTSGEQRPAIRDQPTAVKKSGHAPSGHTPK